MPSLRELIREAFHHPGRVGGLAIRRIFDIPRLGLPKPRSEVVDDFDTKHGVNTARSVQAVVTRSANRRHGTRYETTSEHVIRWCIENAETDPRSTTFIDFGCGKGRTLIVAADYGFKAVVGVEYSQELAQIASQNLRSCGLSDRCVVLTVDAADYALPAGPLFAYFFNPFGAAVHVPILRALRSHGAPVVVAHKGPGNDTVRAFGLSPFASLPAEAAHLYRFSPQ